MAEETPAEQPAKPRRHWIVRWSLRGVVAFSALLVLVCVLALSWRTRMSWKAEAKLQELRDAGYPTNAEEAYEYYQTLQVGPDVTEEWRAVAKALDDVSADQVIAELTSWRDAFGVPHDKRLCLAISPELLERLLADSAEILPLVERAVERERRLVFAESFSGGIYPSHLVSLRRAANLLCFQALLQSRAGDFDAAADSIAPMLQLARMLLREPSDSSWEWGGEAVAQAADATRFLLTHDGVSADAIAQLSQSFASVDVFAAIAESQPAKSAVMLPYFDDVRRFRDEVVPDVILTKFPIGSSAILLWLNSPADLNVFLDIREEFRNACSLPPHEAVPFAQRAEEERLQRFHLIAPEISAEFVTNPTAMARSMSRWSFQVDACRVSLAVRAYQRDHKQLPTALGDLVPAYLDAVPLSPVDGRPIGYVAAGADFALLDHDHPGFPPGAGGVRDTNVEKVNAFLVAGVGGEDALYDRIEAPANLQYGWQVQKRRMYVLQTANYENGLKHGTETRRYLDGTSKTTEYVEGKRQGECISLPIGADSPEDAPVLASGTYVDDQPFEGTFREWIDGEPVIVRYELGERVDP